MRALDIEQEDFETNFNLGVLFYEWNRDYEKAIHYFNIALNDEKNINALFNLAVIYEEIADYSKAKQLYMDIL